MSRIAKHAGVTPNTIYWYFDDKDSLLVAVLDQLLSEHLTQYQAIASAPLAEQLYWVVGSLRGVSRRQRGRITDCCFHNGGVDLSPHR